MPGQFTTTLFAWLAMAGPLALLAGILLPDRHALRLGLPARFADRMILVSAGALAAMVAAAAALAAAGPYRSGTLGVAGVGLSVQVDALSAIMGVLVAFIGFVVLRYSRNYLDGDAGQVRFLRWLALTVAAVLWLILSGNVLQMILAFVATSVGLNTLLLYYPERQAAQLAARKKFVVSRLADACLVGAAALLLARFGTLDLVALRDGARSLSTGAPGWDVGLAALLVAIAALLKSAQLPVHGWILEVMETPTPVSALLHAGIINAGGFLVLRMADVVTLSGPAMEVLTIVGGATALFGSVVMLTQTSIKVSLAYSTVAQMGFMLLQCGLGAYSAALLHIVAHSLYKAHAFLSSGSVIDLARASWAPSPGGQPHPARVALALVAVVGATLGIAALFGMTATSKPGAVVLGAILMMGLVHLVANAIDERPNGYVIGKTAAFAVGVAVVYFALQALSERLLAGALPPTQPLRGLFDTVTSVLIVASFGVLTIMQGHMARHAQSPFWQAAYVHLSHGLYLNTIANRLVLRFWPRTTQGA